VPLGESWMCDLAGFKKPSRWPAYVELMMVDGVMVVRKRD
jgi:hypothetical protein